MTFQMRMLKGFAMAAVLAGGLAVSGSFREANVGIGGKLTHPAVEN